MEHRLIPATWKSREGLEQIIRDGEAEGWSVTALGEVMGGTLLVAIRDGKNYEHQILSVMARTENKVGEILAEKNPDAWQVCAIGECFGSVIMIMKRELP